MLNGYVDDQGDPPTGGADDGRRWSAPLVERCPDPTISRLLARAWGAGLALRRLEGSLSQAGLARRCGVTQQTISKIERGLMVPLDPLKLRL